MLFLPKGKAPDEKNAKESRKNTGDHLNLYDLPFSAVLFTKSGAQCSAWMDGSVRTCSVLFLPPSVCFLFFFCLAPFCPSAPFLARSHQASQPLGPRQQRGGCGREECSQLPVCPGDLGTCLLHSWARSRDSHAALQQLAVSDRPLSSAANRRRKWLCVTLLPGNGSACVCAESCSQPHLNTVQV